MKLSHGCYRGVYRVGVQPLKSLDILLRKGWASNQFLTSRRMRKSIRKPFERGISVET